MRQTTGLLIAVLAAAVPAAAQEEDETPRFTVGGILDTRLARTDITRSWLDGGLGKARYGGLEGQQAELARLSQASLLLDASLGELLTAHVQLRVDAEPDNALRRGKAGLVEAFATWRPELSPAVRLRVKTGLFFPPISLEHPLRGWTTTYTITPSAANSWVGEEIRTAGVEGNFVLRVADNDLTATGAVFGMNDPTGTILSWRGWALHDRTSQTADELPFATGLPAFRPGAAFANNATWTSPIREVDGRLGWYAGASWRWPAVLEARALYYDNRGNPTAFDGRQYAWYTEFWNLGVRLELPGPVELIGQHLFGETAMGLAPDGGHKVDNGYATTYGLLTARAGRHRVSVRYDKFEVEDRDGLRVEDDNDEDGEAWTAAYLLETGEHHRLAFEWMRITSDRAARASVGLPRHAEEDLFQASFRLLF